MSRDFKIQLRFHNFPEAYRAWQALSKISLHSEVEDNIDTFEDGDELASLERAERAKQRGMVDSVRRLQVTF